MTVLVATVGAYVCCLTLLMSGLIHAHHVREFQIVLRRQRLIPPRFVAVGGQGITAVELVLGSAGLLALGAQSEAVARPVLATAAALFAVYAAYTAYLVMEGRNVPCGCSAGDDPVNSAVVARAAALSVAALAASLAAGRILAPVGNDKFAIAATASIGLTAILWALPAALHDPETAQASAPVSTPTPLEGAR